MSWDPFAYRLRFAVQPGHREDEKLDRLVRLCEAAAVDDVMFFMNQEELNRGHLTLEETKPWMDVVAKGKARLDAIGVTTSLNPWTSLLGADRGRTLRPSQRFRLMVDPYGRSATAQACPLCEDFRGYLAEIYACYAELKPDTIWVEDDFRFHNHAPLEWGGCFCDAHMALFAERAGVPSLDRASFVRAVTAPGEPHPYRRVWLDANREALVGLAGVIASAVHRVSRETRLGLMTSCPDIHAAEGRDWRGIFEAFGGGRKPAAIRPHLPAYTEDSGYKYWWRFNAVSRPTAALVPSETPIYPELENYPYTLYSKSAAFQRFQTETALLLGSAGITMNILEMGGNGTYPAERPEGWMRETKPYLNAVASLGLHAQRQRGVQTLLFERSAYTLRTASGERLEELYPQETLWASLLSAYGVANRFAANGALDEEAVAVSGQALRNAAEAGDGDALAALFRGRFVLLDGEAVETLLDIGRGDLLGIRGARWHEPESGFQSYEQVTNGETYAELEEARMIVQIFAGSHLEIDYDEAPDEISAVMNPDGRRVSAGMAVARGNVFILPYGRFGGGVAGSHALLNPIRKEAVQRAMERWAASEGESARLPAMVTSYSPHLSVYAFETAARGRVYALVNASMDEIDGWELRVEDEAGAARWTMYSRSAPEGAPVEASRGGGGRVAFAGRIPPLSTCVLACALTNDGNNEEGG
ncbi:hypothetical protein [Paenibacillus sp.]|uniref:hypothetical protein n=1 Tax=Paenibacillus sp. TaxID=58172 RepID=UPI002D50626A|nr:hypothetical protein [Paenibacillus sp.]HZG55038.1 hypothetical protein [Paenibacillus sp.]